MSNWEQVTPTSLFPSLIKFETNKRANAIQAMSSTAKSKNSVFNFET